MLNWMHKHGKYEGEEAQDGETGVGASGEPSEDMAKSRDGPQTLSPRAKWSGGNMRAMRSSSKNVPSPAARSHSPASPISPVLGEDFQIPSEAAPSAAGSKLAPPVKQAFNSQSSQGVDPIVPDGADRTEHSLKRGLSNANASVQWRKLAAVAKIASTSHRETRRRMTMQNVIDHRYFGCAVAFVVIAHLVWQGYETDTDMGTGIGSASFTAETTFVSFYLLELACRVSVGYRQYIADLWNLFDLVLILVSLGDLILVAFLASSSSSLSVVVVLRSVRIFRLARLFRLLRIFKPLWLLVCGIVKSMKTVVWAWLLIGIVVYMFGLVFVRTLQPYRASDPEVEELFGTVGRSMFSVFQVVTLEDWPALAEVSTRHEPWLLVCFGFVLCTCTWGILNVVVAVFVEGTVDASSLRANDLAKQKKAEYDAGCRKVYEIFLSADADGDGSLTREEFVDALDRPEIMKEFRAIGIDRTWAEELFDVLDVDQSETLDAVEFIEGMMRSLGTAPNKDVVAMRCDLWRIQLRAEDEINLASQFIAERLRRTLLGISSLESGLAPLVQRAGAGAPSIRPPSQPTASFHGPADDINRRLA